MNLDQSLVSGMFRVVEIRSDLGDGPLARFTAKRLKGKFFNVAYRSQGSVIGPRRPRYSVRSGAVRCSRTRAPHWLVRGRLLLPDLGMDEGMARRSGGHG